METGKTSKYLKYAIGEIILVVIGILIALQINNWNENRKAEAELIDVYKQIVLDLDNDIPELSSNLERYENLKPVFDKVLSDSRTVDLLDDGLSRIVSWAPHTNLNNSGINRLKSITVNDSLSLKIIETYDLLKNVYILPLEKNIGDQAKMFTSKYRDKYDWYPEWINKRITKDNSSEELQDYFVNSREYRHYVISSYQQIYNRYVPALEVQIPKLKNIRNELRLKIDK
ncbi:MAG: hypothetical protein KJO63_00535 [Maribacter sp.]|nr:hypothetical protein [Maribacter sp.]